MSKPSPAYVSEFIQSLPKTYAERFDQPARERHAALALDRGAEPASVGLFDDSRMGTAALCVVADDRPGLLATISAALVMSELDVVAAEAFTRRTPVGNSEAVDIFWVQRASATPSQAPLTTEVVEALHATLSDMLREVRPRTVVPPKSDAPQGPQTSETVVRFLEGSDGFLATLEVETDDRSGLLLALSRALFDQRVQIVASEVRTQGQRVLDRFTVVELDDSPIKAERRLAIQVAILSAIETTYSRGR